MVTAFAEVHSMQRRRLTFIFPEVFVISATRALLGFGVGLLLAGRLGPMRRRRLGWPAFLVGALSSVPILIHLLRKSSSVAASGSPSAAAGVERSASSLPA